MSRYKILCVTDNLGTSGARLQLVDIALFLCQMGYDVDFITYKSNSYQESTLIQQGIKLVKIPPCRLLMAMIRIRKIIRNGNYNLVVAFGRTPSFICELSGLPRRKWKLVISERSSRQKKDKSFLGRLYSFFHVFADSIVCNTFTNCRIVLESNHRINPDKVHVIYNCHDFSNWKHPQPGPSDDTNYILKMLVVAGENSYHSLSVFLDALQQLSFHERSAIRIEWIVNSLDKLLTTDQLDLIKLQVQQKKLHLYIRNYPYDIAEMIAETDIVGLFNCTGKVPKEFCIAMAYGKPIIATNTSDIPLLLEEGQGGFLCNTNDPSSLAIALHKFIRCTSSQRHEMGRHNMLRARFLFCKEHTLQRYVFLFQKLLNH